MGLMLLEKAPEELAYIFYLPRETGLTDTESASALILWTFQPLKMYEIEVCYL